jgi:hypothetical protein
VKLAFKPSSKMSPLALVAAALDPSASGLLSLGLSLRNFCCRPLASSTSFLSQAVVKWLARPEALTRKVVLEEEEEELLLLLPAAAAAEEEEEEEEDMMWGQLLRLL